MVPCTGARLLDAAQAGTQRYTYHLLRRGSKAVMRRLAKPFRRVRLTSSPFDPPLEFLSRGPLRSGSEQVGSDPVREVSRRRHLDVTGGSLMRIPVTPLKALSSRRFQLSAESELFPKPLLASFDSYDQARQYGGLFERLLGQERPNELPRLSAAASSNTYATMPRGFCMAILSVLSFVSP